MRLDKDKRIVVNARMKNQGQNSPDYILFEDKFTLVSPKGDQEITRLPLSHRFQVQDREEAVLH